MDFSYLLKTAKSDEGNFLNKDGLILDAKYKSLEKGFVRDDLYQIISYMHTMNIPTGGFLYPLSSNVEESSSSSIVKKTFHLAGLGGKVSTYGILIPQNAKNYSEFKMIMERLLFNQS